MSKQATAQRNVNTGLLTTEHQRYTLIERFLQRPALNAVLVIDAGADSATALANFVQANKNFEVLGTNMTTALCTFADGGGVTVTTATAASDSSIILPHLDTTQTAWAATKWNTLDRVAFSTRIKTGSAITATIWAGLKLTNTPVVATDNDQVFFRYSDAHATYPTKLLAVYSNAGTDYEIDTGIVMAASTSYELEITIDADRIPRFYVAVGNDGKQPELVATGTALASNIDLIPYVGILTSTAAGKALTVRSLSLAKDLND